MRARAHIALVPLLTALAAAAPARAEELTPRKQALIMLRVLAYDRNLAARAREVVRVAVAYRPGDRRSEAQRDDLVEALGEVSREVVVAGRPVELVEVPYRDAADFEVRLHAVGASVLYVGSRLAPVAKEIAAATRRLSVLSVAGSKELVEAGLAVGLVHRGERAGVVVNLSATKAEGADLDPALLSIAEVIR